MKRNNFIDRKVRVRGAANEYLIAPPTRQGFSFESYQLYSLYPDLEGCGLVPYPMVQSKMSESKSNKFGFEFYLLLGDKKSQHGCVRWALRELRALHEHLTCNHAMISPAAGLRIVCDSFHCKGF